MPQRKLLISFRNIARKIWIIVLAAFFICLIGGIVLSPFLIKIRNIECYTQYGSCSNDIDEKLVQYNGKSLLFAKKKIKLTLNSEKSVKSYTLQFKFPNSLKINILIKKPVFCIKNSESFMLISDSGQVVSISRECSLPKVISNGIVKNIGENIDEANLSALKIIQGVYEMYQVSEGTLNNNSLTVEIKPGLTVIFPVNTGNPAAMLGALRLIYTKIENEGEKFSEIDLRFENPVLR